MTTDAQDTDLINRLDFVDEQERVYFASAQLGEQVRIFLTQPTGRYLHGRAKAQLEECKEKLLDVASTDTPTIERIQRDADIARSFMRWCADAITDGELAYRALEENYDN